MDVVSLIVLPALCGVGIGIFSGLLGIGGGTVMVPAFRLLFDMSPTMSTATSMFAIIPTSISGATQHLRNKTCLPAVGLAAGIGGAFTSPVGVWLAQCSPGWMVMLAAALVIGYSAFTMLQKAVKMGASSQGESSQSSSSQSSPAQGLHSQSSSSQAETQATAEPLETPAATSVTSVTSEAAPTKTSRRQLALAAGIGLIAGVASGYVGVGGGFLMVPLFISLIGLSMKQASGTSLIAVMILAVPGVIEQMLLGNVNYFAGLAIVAGTVPGAIIGARLVRRVPERALRFIFGGFLAFAAIMLAVNEFGLIG
ncbi:sulfite exporter TauE/SafE family protein [Adlercreutzia sp. ZJ141]|uniref:sulfite exporter TauE/SafE family protein n=1 Tax=Adlercreutzia sp. ZJ141 TaxID=2709406 RepID=UPI0013EBE9DF|nr:sulfite exporter TauE/SafE family protein [Adlercreutzia sp. ZJ141]